MGEESWVKTLFAPLVDDPHPDAIAMRLRVTLQCAECGELPPFGGGDEKGCVTAEETAALLKHRLDFMRQEYDRYIFKWSAVSATCRSRAHAACRGRAAHCGVGCRRAELSM